MGGLGFIFWVVCSRLYSPHDVGLATSLISAATLMAVLATLGFNNVIIRFLASSKRPDQQLSTAFILTTIASLVVGLGFLLWAAVTQNPSLQTHHMAVLIASFLLAVTIQTANNLLEGAFIAHRAAKYLLIKNTIMSILKLGLVFLTLSLGFVGIVSSTALAVAIAWACGFVWLIRKFNYRPTWVIDKTTLRETRRFAAGNYAGLIFGMLPSTLVPLIVASRLSPGEAAFFYMPMMIVTLLNIIPISTAQSLFAEVSHNEAQLNKHLADATRHLFLMLTPAVLAVLLLGNTVLGFFGPEYAHEGTGPLRILALASLVGGINYLGDTLLNIKKYAGLYVIMNALNSLIIVGLAYVNAPHGLMAVAISSLVGQVVTLVVYAMLNWRLLVAQWATTRTGNVVA